MLFLILFLFLFFTFSLKQNEGSKIVAFNRKVEMSVLSFNLNSRIDIFV